jgi:diguanylate cyclase (GGDEF)-like protein
VLDEGRRCVMYIAGPQADSEANADRIVQLVDQATPAYRIALDRADDRARAEFDGLTGLLTPRAFRARLATAIERARCTPLGRVGVVFVDTDHFKAWNDTYGHASGDALLRELARLLRAAAVTEDDFAGRNGGDEFCLVFAGCEKSAAVERAERLRASIAGADMRALRPPESVGAAVAISASIGVACFPIDAQTPNDLLEKADAAMYHSKRTGRDGVAYFSAESTIVRAQSGPALSEKLQ